MALPTFCICKAIAISLYHTPDSTSILLSPNQQWLIMWHSLMCVLLVQDLRLQLTAALDRTATTSRDVWKSYWAAQQRFFKLMCVSFKVSKLPPAARPCKLCLFRSLPRPSKRSGCISAKCSQELNLNCLTSTQNFQRELIFVQPLGM